MLAAEYTVGRKGEPKGWLDINVIANGHRQHVETIGVSGKREARQIAAARGATPWNF